MKKIIIVEDDEAVADSLKLILEPVGYHITIYSNGNSLLDTQFELPDLFILDKQLIGISGLDICIFLKKKERTSKIPVILLSASPDICKNAPTVGADDVLEKPFPMQVLREMVAKHI
jgi:DNA-binding response OmpR family regulator